MQILARRLLFLVVTLALIGCAEIKVKSPHLNIDPDGYAADDAGRAFQKPANQDGSTAEEHVVTDIMDQISDRVAERCSVNGTGKAHIMLFVHGGMVSTRTALKESSELEDEKVFHNRNIDPVFINWNSSLLSALADDLFWVRSGNRYREGVLIAPFVAAARLVNGIFSTLPNLWFQVQDETRFFQKWPEERTTFVEGLGDGAVGLVHLPFTVASTPFFTGFGRGSWNMMKRRVDVMYSVQKAPKRFFNRRTDRKPGVMRTFLKELSAQRKVWEEECEGFDFELDYFGHSMGALVGTRMLGEFPDLEFDRVIFAAPASTAEDFVTTIPGYLERNDESKFYSYGLSVIDEGNELSLLSAAFPRGSLLVWVDNFFDPILSPEDYRLGDFWNSSVFKVPIDNPRDPVCERIKLIKFGGERKDRQDWPRKHGEFNDPDELGQILDLTMADTFPTNSCKACAVFDACRGSY